MIDECHYGKNEILCNSESQKDFKKYFHLMVIDYVGRYPMTI